MYLQTFSFQGLLQSYHAEVAGSQVEQNVVHGIRHVSPENLKKELLSLDGGRWN